MEISPAQHIESAIPPTIIFHGTNDESVPLATAEKFQELAIAKGSRCELVTYRDQGHGFFNYRRGGNPGEYFLRTVGELDRFLVSLGWLNGAAGVAAVDSPNAHLRQDYHQLARKFRETKRGSVAFLGGSITEMDGYRPMVAKFLRQEFPETEFTFTNAGIASTCSTTGAYRLQRDVLNAKPDLLLVEFAVNDDQDAAHAARECRRGMEGILRHTLSANPETKIVVTHFVNPTMLQTLTEGSTPLSSGTHEEVAEHYQVSSSDLAREVAERIGRGELTWEEYGGTHPKKPGNRIAADLVIELLSAGWDESAFRFPAPGKRRLPKPLDAGSYDRGRLVDVRRANLDSKTKPSWNIQVPEWSSLPGQCRSRFVDSEMLVAEAPGASLTLSFTGTTIGAYLLAGPDAGMVEVSVDGSPYRTIDLYHRYSRGLHYPRTVMFAGDLDDGTHQLSLRVSEDRHAQSQGTAVRILQFAVNGGD